MLVNFSLYIDGTDNRYINPYPFYYKFLSLPNTPFNCIQSFSWGAEINEAHSMKNGIEKKTQT